MHKMHLVIIKRVNDVLNRNLDKLMLGVSLPNLSNYDHNVSHFRKDSCLSDIDLFVSKYKDKLEDDIMLGYLIHLLIDNFFKEFFNDNIITYDDNGKANGYIFNGIKRESNFDSIKDMIKQDYKSYSEYLLDKKMVNKYSSDECVKDYKTFLECSVDSNHLYEHIISSNMDVDKHKNVFKLFKRYKFRVLPRDMYDDLMNRSVLYVLEQIKRVNAEVNFI